MHCFKSIYFFIQKKNYVIATIAFLFFSIFFTGTLFAQHSKTMQSYENDLNELFDMAFTSKTDNERFNANEQAMLLLEEALSQPKSFFFNWDNMKKISILKSSDNRFKIYTWAIIKDNEEYDCFGYIQALNSKTNNYEVSQLVDRTQDIFNPEEVLLNEMNWYGAVYYDLITTKYENRVYYTLLGWTGNNCVSQKKVIEPVFFKTNSSKPIFGQSVFYKDKNRRRIIFEYSKQATMMLRYDKQSYIVTEKKKKRNKPTVKKEKIINENMIVFDVLSPMVGGMENINHYYIPCGEENAYIFEDGKWHLTTNVETGLHNKKYDAFTPTKKPPRNIYKP